MKTTSWGKRFAFPIAVLAAVAALCVPATAELRLLQPDAAVPATFVGRGGVSTDGLGQNGGGGTIQADVPAGSTVVQAYLYATYIQGSDNPSDADRTIQMDGVDHLLAQRPVDPAKATDLSTARGDVTSQVAAKVGSGGGVTNFVINNDPSPLDGVALVVIYSNPSLPVTTIAVLDGESAFSGDSFTFNFSTPLEVDRPGFSATLAVGSGFSYQNGQEGHICGGEQFSTIDVNSQRVSSCAGNFDDGLGEDGALITVGGVGDNIDNPADPQATDGGTDDELYNLVPFLKNGDPSITVETTNASRNDNLFLAVLKVTQTTGAQQTVPVAQPDSAKAASGQATGIDVLANDTDPDHLLVPNTVSIATPPAHGTAAPNSNGSGEVIYTSTAGYVGTDSFVYQVCGVDQTLCTTATVTVTVGASAPPAAAVDAAAAFTG